MYMQVSSHIVLVCARKMWVLPRSILISILRYTIRKVVERMSLEYSATVLHVVGVEDRLEDKDTPAPPDRTGTLVGVRLLPSYL